MDPQFWLDRWRNGRIGFHQPAVDRSLQRHWPSLNLAGSGPHRSGPGPLHPDKGRRVFVPLCGKSLDLLWLREQGHFVTGVEISAAALEAFCMENGVPARRRVRGDFEAYEADNLELLRGDFFKLTPALLGKTAAVYDRAALVSWSPELRPAYARHLGALVAPGTPMLLITLEYLQPQMAGPPFSVAREEIERLYSGNFDLREVDRRDILATEARLRSKGLSELTEVCHLLVRR